ncbi:nucleoside deaminase [Flavobacteriaceae bacterium AU392]|nr:nucleoside deaminase [Flavobacteriaceae bacterium]RKM82653.1 nucleoside deaminase [Flavobacteriaceae bacterium AU392]
MESINESEYTFYMQKCIELALIAKQRGDTPVGSIVVKNGEIIGEGIEGGKTKKDITYHSEIEAIRDARKRLHTSDLSDCILVSTHEPCLMCSYTLRHHKINVLIFSLSVGEIGGYSSKFKILEDESILKWGNPPKIITGILEKECRALHH